MWVRLFFNLPGFFVKSIGAVPTTALAAVTALEMVLLGKAAVAFGREVVIAFFYGDVFF